MANKVKNPFKIGLYIRVSTEEQAENPEGSIRNQEDRLRQAVTYKNAVGNFGKIYGTYVDAGISAKNMNRPQLQALLRDIQNGEIDLVMVTELSRLSRNSRDFIQMWDMMRAHGCRFTSLREDFDTTNAAGELVLFQLMNLAQFERRQTSERVEANMATRAERGLYNGGPVPIGYKLIPEKPGYLDVDEESAAMVRLAFTSFLREGCLSHAALWMNNQGYKIKRHMEGGGRFMRTGHFTVDNLNTMLRNKAYIGIKVFTFKEEQKEAKAVWPAIIDEVIFKRVGEILDKNRRRFKPYKKGRMPYLFSGLTCCASCKSPMSGKTATGSTSKVAYYEHGWATKRDSTLSKKIFKCDPHRVPAKILEPAAWSKVHSFVTDELFMRRIFEKVKMHYEQNPKTKELEQARAKLFGVNSQIEALSERISELPKEVSAEPLYRQLGKLQSIQKDLENAVQKFKLNGKSCLDRIAKLSTFEEFARHYKKLLANELSVPEKKLLIQKFVRKLEVGVKTYKIHFIVDEDHYRKELALKKASSNGELGRISELRVFLNGLGSNTLTIGDRGTTRTCDLLLRRQLLYPAELRDH